MVKLLHIYIYKQNVEKKVYSSFFLSQCNYTEDKKKIIIPLQDNKDVPLYRTLNINSVYTKDTKRTNRKPMVCCSVALLKPYRSMSIAHV